MGNLLNVKNLTIKFGGLTAVNMVNMEIGDNNLVGLIGPNGAGKTTLFNMLTGLTESNRMTLLPSVSPERFRISGYLRI